MTPKNLVLLLLIYNFDLLIQSITSIYKQKNLI